MKIEKFEFNKPSELCQVVFVDKIGKEFKMVTLTKLQIDMINALLYAAREHIIKNNLIISTESVGTEIPVDLNKLSTAIGKYKNGQFADMIDALTQLSDIKILINALNKNKEKEAILTRFILRMVIPDNHKRKIIPIVLSNDILHMILNVKKYFSKMYLFIQFAMNSKYSKLLYELLKDYEGINMIAVKYDELLDLLNISSKSQRDWFVFRGNILEKAVKEINAKSDILISYEPIREKLDGQRKMVTAIKFTIDKQSEDTLKRLGIIDEENDDIKLLARKRFDNLPKYRKDKIENIDAYIKVMIENEREEFEAMLRINKFIEEQKSIFTGSDQPETIVMHHTISDRYFVIDNSYFLINLDNKVTETKSAKETLSELNDWIVAEELEIVTLELGIKDDWSNSTIIPS